MEAKQRDIKQRLISTFKTKIDLKKKTKELKDKVKELKDKVKSLEADVSFRDEQIRRQAAAFIREGLNKELV